MATYAELAALPEDSGWGAFMNKVGEAVKIKATAVIDATSPPTARLDWAKSALSDAQAAANNLVFYVVASNKGLTTAAILGASDSAVQNNVDAAVDAIYT